MQWNKDYQLLQVHTCTVGTANYIIGFVDRGRGLEQNLKSRQMSSLMVCVERGRDHKNLYVLKLSCSLLRHPSASRLSFSNESS